MTDKDLQPTAPAKKSLFARIRNKIFIGVLLSAPVIATIWIFSFLLRVATSWFPKKLFSQLNDTYNTYLLEFLILLVVLVFFWLLGSLAHYFFGKKLYQLSDKLFSGIPFIKTIYLFVRHVCEWVVKSRNTLFESVVLVEYPRTGSYAIGFVTATTASGIIAKIKGPDGKPLPCKNVFIPTTPNPTSGFFLILPEKDLVTLDIPVPDAINLIISGGAILPETTDKSASPFVNMIDSLVSDKDSR
jgi:uncharacterized membrane protein